MNDAVIALNNKKNLTESLTTNQRKEIDRQISEILLGSKSDATIVIPHLTDVNIYYLERCGYNRQSEDTFVFGTIYTPMTEPIIYALKTDPLNIILRLAAIYLFVATIRLFLGY